MLTSTVSAQLPALTVVMPSLNQASFIQAAVRSVLQGECQRLELIVSDGGSSDGTLRLLAELTDISQGRLQWSSARDSGPAEAVNRAVEMARAPLIGWLNSDDLYTQGAVQRAIDHFARHPSHVMVYGHGEHIDSNGAVIGHYPTLGPSTPRQAFADSCFICQPTVFFRRDAYLAIGGIDTTLRTAFDFDLWLRLFQAYPGRIGFIDAVQAQSRLHEASITVRMRECVAMEALMLLRRHLDVAPAHWLLTHFDELFARHPFHPERKDLRTEFGRLIAEARAYLKPADADDLLRRTECDRRLGISTPDLYVAVHPDGWAGASMQVRFRQPEIPLKCIELACVKATPGGATLQLGVSAPDGSRQDISVAANGAFSISLDLPDRRPGACMIFTVRSASCFVPSDVEFGSGDNRCLAYRVERAAVY